MVVGVVGLGSVGSAVYNVMRDHHPTVGYDVDGRGSFDQVSHQPLSSFACQLMDYRTVILTVKPSVLFVWI